MAKVTVYYFRGFSPDRNIWKNIESKVMAPLEWIKQQGYEPILETAKQIETSALDANGFYRESKYK
jgi:hypothetical protein